jgi:hypothetical protein
MAKAIIYPAGIFDADYSVARIMCPGCGREHTMRITGQYAWGFNNDVEKPTFTPSILAEWGSRKGAVRCHSYVTDGKIQFLNDCSHDMKGQTVDLPDIEPEEV